MLFVAFILFCNVLISPPEAVAQNRGLIIKTKLSSGEIKNFQLYNSYYALIIGCSQYQNGWQALPNPVNDAKEIASLTQSLGWETEVLKDPSSKTLKRKLNQVIYGPGRERDKAILIWFSGHGHTIPEADGTKLGYIVPIDSPNPSFDPVGFSETAISMREIETISKQIMSKHVLMIFDSCFSGSVFKTLRSKPSFYIQEMVVHPVREFLTAGNEKEQVPDKSVFKDVFIQGIKYGFADLNKDNYITGAELGMYLQEQVVNYSEKAQHPQFGKINNPKLDKGDFVFSCNSKGKYEPNAIRGDKIINNSINRKPKETLKPIRPSDRDW